MFGGTGLLPQLGALGASNDHQPADGPQPCRQELRRKAAVRTGLMPAAEEAVMRTIPPVLITFVALSLSPTAARAGANGSWCANYGTGLDGSINCSYTSFEQCRATVSGIYGFCTPNPYPGTGYGRGGTWNLTPTSRGRSYRTER